MEYFVDFPPLISGVGVERLGAEAAPSISWGQGVYLETPETTPGTFTVCFGGGGWPGLKEEGEIVGIIFVGLVARHVRLSLK